MYSQNKLKKTGRVFCWDIGNPNDGMNCIEEEKFEFNNQKYIRSLNLNPEKTLSNGGKAKDEKYRQQLPNIGKKRQDETTRCNR